MDKNRTKQVATSFGDRCNNCCIFCFNRSRGRLRDETRGLEAVKRDIVLGAKRGANILSLEGGETTISEEIFETIKFARKNGFSKIEIITNGRMFSYEKFAKEIVEAGVTKIIFSVHGHNPKLHDSLTRVDGSFKQLYQGIGNLKKLNFPNICSHTIIIKQNYGYLPGIGELLVKLGIKDSMFSFVIPMGDAKNNFFEIVPFISETVPFLHKTLELGKKHGFFWKVRYYPLCCLGDYRKFSQRITYAKIPKRRKVPQCFKCMYFNECDGIWEEYIKNMGHNEVKPIEKNYQVLSHKIFSQIEKLKKKETFIVAKSLEGLNIPEAWKLRMELKEKEPKAVLMSLSGLDTKEAWRIRSAFKQKERVGVLMSIMGMNTEEAWRLREELKEKEPFAVARSLEGLNTEQAWKLREELKDKESWAVAESLRSLNTKQAWKLRNELKFKEIGEVIESLEGLDTEEAWRLREEFKYKEPKRVARSLKGIGTERAWQLREEFKSKESFAVAWSLKGLNAEQAWRLREELKEKEPFAVARSLEGLNTEQAWKLREELRKKHNDDPYILAALLR